MGAVGKMMNSGLRRGQVTILVAGIIVVFLLLFFVVGIDFARIYYVRGELQNAADAAALAGAKILGTSGGETILDTGTNYQQMAARQAAWQYACRNKAAHQNVFLEQKGSCDPASDSVACCDTPPSSGLNESNADGGDIVVGYWDNFARTFTRADGTTNNPINAMKVVDQRISGLESSGRGAVGLLFGGKLVGWSVLDVRRQAIASVEITPISPTPLCVSTCALQTPLTTQTGNNTPGTRFFLKIQDGIPVTAWTSFLDKNTSNNLVLNYFNGKSVPPICNQCLYTTQGLGNIACEVRQKIRDRGADYQIKDSLGTVYRIHGWKALIPILDDTVHDCQAKNGCFFEDPDPGNQPNDAYYVINYAEVVITDAVPQANNCPQQNDAGPFAAGMPGIVIVGTGDGTTAGSSSIKCLDCNDSSFNSFIKVKLVK
jgi:hypothetical protein